MSLSCKNKRKIKKVKFENADIGLKSKLKSNDSVNSITELSTTKQSDSNIDDNLPSTVTLLKTPDGGKCYLVGTAHFSVESQNDVSRIIKAVQPQIVSLELCMDRIDILKVDEDTFINEASNLNFNNIARTIKENGMNKGLIFLLSFKLLANLTKTLGVAPGGEFRKALTEIQKIPNCYIHMGDRPIKITFSRALSFLTWWQTVKIAWQLLTQKVSISQQDIDRYKCRDLVEELMKKLAKEYPALEEVFVKERDLYLTHSLQLACKPKIEKFGEQIPMKVVGIVGIGHVDGIIKNWGKVKESQIPPIMSIPPPALSSKVLVFAIKASIVGTVIYMLYNVFPTLLSIILLFKSSVQELIQVSIDQ